MFKAVLLELAGEWPTYDYRRLSQEMRRLDWPVNSKRVRRWMEELGISGKPPTRTRRTTDSNHAFGRINTANLHTRSQEASRKGLE